MVSRTRILSTLIPLLALSAGVALAEDDRSYGYVRTLEGAATSTGGDTGVTVSLLANYPLQVGDRILTDDYTRAELVLADFNILRLAGRTEIDLVELAFSADSDDRRTLLYLEQGAVQIVVTEHALGDELPRIETANASIYVHEPGTYFVEVVPGAFTRAVVRSGYAEIATPRGSAVARLDEEVLIEGEDAAVVSVASAGPLEDVEIWGEELRAAAPDIDVEGLDPALGYSAAALEGSGEWLEIGRERAWRPHVEVSWRPYTHGTWVSTYSGLTWVGYEPWGWVTGHYGYWSHHAHWGWIWYPGHAYSPARVYWYWGPGWVGWVPTGYYGHWGYRPFYGYVGGPWGYYRHWTFCPTLYFGHRKGHRYHYGGHEMDRVSGRPAVPRGVIASETRGITRAVWRDGADVGRVLAARGGDAPRDLTDFVASRRDTPFRRPATDRALGAGEVADSRSGADSRGRSDRGWRDAADRRRLVSSADVQRDAPFGIRRDASGLTPADSMRPGSERRDWGSERRDWGSERRDGGWERRDGGSGDSSRGWRSDRGVDERSSLWRSHRDTDGRSSLWRGGDSSAADRDGDASWRSIRERYDSGRGGSSFESDRERLPPARRVIDGVVSRSGDSSSRSTTRERSGDSSSSRRGVTSRERSRHDGGSRGEARSSSSRRSDVKSAPSRSGRSRSSASGRNRSRGSDGGSSARSRSGSSGRSKDSKGDGRNG